MRRAHGRVKVRVVQAVWEWSGGCAVRFGMHAHWLQARAHGALLLLTAPLPKEAKA